MGLIIPILQMGKYQTGLTCPNSKLNSSIWTQVICHQSLQQFSFLSSLFFFCFFIPRLINQALSHITMKYNIAYNLLTDCLWARKYVVLHTREPFNAQHHRRGLITPILQVTESRANRQLAQSNTINVTGGELRFKARSVWLQHALNYCDQLLSKQQVLSSIDRMMEEEKRLLCPHRAGG